MKKGNCQRGLPLVDQKGWKVGSEVNSRRVHHGWGAFLRWETTDLHRVWMTELLRFDQEHRMAGLENNYRMVHLVAGTFPR